MEARLWPDTCLDYQKFSNIYSSISGSNPSGPFEPRVCPLLASDHWGPEDKVPNSICSRTNPAGGPYTFSCRDKTGNTNKDTSLPAFCMQDIAGNFRFSAQVLSSSESGAYVGPVISGDHTTKDGTHIAALTDIGKTIYRWRDGGSGTTNNQQGPKPSPPSIGPELFVGIERLDESFVIKYTTDDSDPFSGWTELVTPIITSGNMPSTFDLCLIFANTVVDDNDQVGTFDNVNLSLLPPSSEDFQEISP